jgi:hypothetical protein
MPIKPPGKSNIACKECGYILSNRQAFLIKMRVKKFVCPKCRSDKITLIMY